MEGCLSGALEWLSKTLRHTSKTAGCARGPTGRMTARYGATVRGSPASIVIMNEPYRFYIRDIWRIRSDRINSSLHALSCSSTRSKTGDSDCSGRLVNRRFMRWAGRWNESNWGSRQHHSSVPRPSRGTFHLFVWCRSLKRPDCLIWDSSAFPFLNHLLHGRSTIQKYRRRSQRHQVDLCGRLHRLGTTFQ